MENEIKNWSIRVDDEVRGALQGLPRGKQTLNDALRALLIEPAARDMELQEEGRLRANVEEILELLRSLPETFMEAMDAYKARGRVSSGEPMVSMHELPQVAGESVNGPMVVDVLSAAPFNPRCLHCGENFGSYSRSASICPECKKIGHYGEPRNCDVCGQSGSGGL